MGLKKRIKELEKALVEALQRIDKQDKIIEEQKKQIAEFESKQKEKKVPHFIKEDIKKRRKKNGQKIGHDGHNHHTPDTIHEIKEHKLEKCPECGGDNLSKVQEITEQVVTDIPESREVVNIKHKKERKYCRDCKKIFTARILDALPRARFGLRTMLYVLYLKIGMTMPVEKICELLANQYKLKISGGEIIVMLRQLAREFGPYYKELKQKIRESKVRYIDETGRRIAGKNHMIWGFITKEVAYYKIHKSRGHEVPLNVLGKDCEGTNVNDRYSAYYALIKKTNCKMQVCWSHIMDDSKHLAEDFPEGKIIHRRLKRIFKDANAFDHEGTDEDVEQLLKCVDNIRKIRFKSITCGKFIRHICKRDREHLFRFVTDPEIEATSNRIERGLRHDVIIRKISGGNRSKAGARIHENLLSVIQTYKLQNKNILTDGLSYLQNQLQLAK